MEEEEKKVSLPVRQIFVNDVHTYVSRHVAQIIGQVEAPDESEEEDMEDESLSSREETLQVVGTSVTEEKVENLHQLYVSPSREELEQVLLECDVVVYCVTESATPEQIEEATWAISVLQNQMASFETRRYFILVSTLMTWTNFRLSEGTDPGLPFLEEDFLRRRPHPKFRKHNDLEKLVLKCPRGKISKLKGYVVCAGFQYGMGENLFHYFFKVSWLMEEPKVPIFGSGENFIPMIHVCDLGRVVQGIIKVKPSPRYIIAVDDSKTTLEEVVKTISDVLGPEKICKLLPEDAIKRNAFKPEELECLNANLRVEASIVSDYLPFDWTSEEGLVKNIKSIVKEYKVTRQLFPIKICLTGPPAVGKTTLAMKLCQYYKLHYINVNYMFDEKISQLETMIATEEYEEDIAEDAVAAAQDQLENIQKTLQDNQGVLTEDLIFEILREKLYSKGCRNQGFVLDGFPETMEQAKTVFADESQENQDVDVLSNMPWYNKIITPEYIFNLEAPDDFLIKRVQELPESKAEKLRYTQNEFPSCLDAYRRLYRAPVTLLDFYDHRELHPEYLDISTDDSDYTCSMQKIIEIIGEPKNYGGTPEEQEALKRRKEEERKQKLAAEAAERKERKAAALAGMTGHYERWKKSLGMVVEQEAEMSEAKALPLRNYLMKYVMPSLGEAMLECSKVKPEDPVDFLAEHLLRNSTED
ncbi:adenylate kinase 7-like isoform X2 [Poeciliopsis prolifica]|uniref:adenylate kinase 7-like isoform X2 n=1 Tax=Poeciliopsis prolifica TaxID=188132 RepID=UPI002413A846|nr:adenylate kinase 7-like isoform X2 [Poeciliopsis prolifica]XP_054910423.1 adenylate kinase 7-like isoform X2 [Poeciliopsis prolifica]XP_054910424.1 adenylate kinase 7-like isoform X2 [Poeciliopsis prolifica]